MFRGTPKKGNELSGGKILLGALIMPILTVGFFSQGGVNTCSGIFALATIVFWVLAYLHIVTFFRSINWGTPRRQHFTPTEHTPTLPKPTTQQDDSRSIFL